MLIFQAPRRPDGVYVSSTSRITYSIRYSETAEEGSNPRTISYSNSTHFVGQRLSYTLISLSRDTEYMVEISLQVRARFGSVCRYGRDYIYGNYSNPVAFRTNATRK